jgi:endoglucanase
MRYILTLFISLCFLSLYSQDIIYEDRFDIGVLSVGNNPTGYTQTLSDTTYQIIGNGAAGPWTAMSYNMHNGSGSPISIDASDSPKIYIRARGQNQPSLRIDFQDEQGYVTNQNPIEVSLTNNYELYTLDYTGNLFDGGYGGPCTNAPCLLDASRIKSLILFVNAPNGGYTGTIDIDWVSIGAPLSAGGADDIDIRYNQITYLVGRPKMITMAGNLPFSDVSYSIYKEGELEPIMEGKSSGSIWSSSQEYVATVDFSSINEAGNYIFETLTKSVEFSISYDGFEDLCEASLKYYYFNRASQELIAEYAGPWQRSLGHPDDEVIVHSSAASTDRPTGTIISSPKGWYDAGDYNKYIVNSGISTYTLLAAYEHYPEYYDNLSINIPEKGGDIPDLLDEIIWNLDWMLSMQEPSDGGVYHKLTGLNFSGIVMPHQYNFDRYVVQKTTSAALNFAAVTAVASRVFANYEATKPGYSAELLSASEAAYAWAKDNPNIYYNQPGNVSTGEYGDGNVTDEFDWAATELFITTKEDIYLSDINENGIGNGIPSWQYTAPLSLISLMHHSDDISEDININIIENKLLSTANQLRSSVNQSAMRVAMGTGNNDFVWGSNGQAGNQIMLLIRAYEVTNDETYLDAAFIAMDYLLGRNGTGYCYISGFGDQSPLRPHHRQSEADNVNEPVPGMVAGGPNPGQQDGCSGYLGNQAAASYVDSWCSYASNEVTINWNAPLAYSINALQFYQTGITSSTSNISLVEEEILSVIPNPGTDKIYLPQINESSNQVLQIIDLAGNVIYEQKGKSISQNIDVSDLSTGVYVFKLFDDEKIISTKWIKVN